MKNVLCAIVAALAITANAGKAYEKIGGMQVVDAAGLTTAVMKLGEISGNTMVAAMAAAKITELPSSDFFGPTRQGCSIYLPFYIDSEDLASDEDLDDFIDDIQFAMVYPMALPKDEFAKMHPGAIETNGMLCVRGELLKAREEWDDDSVVYVAFSEDGKWAVASKKPEQVALASADLVIADTPMASDVVRFNITPRGVASIRKFITDAEVSRVVNGLDSLAAAFRINNAGIDIRGTVMLVPGSELSEFGTATLADDPFAFADGGAISATADAYTDHSIVVKQLDGSIAVCAENGVDLKPFVSCVETGDTCRISIDIGSAIKHFSEASGKYDDVDMDKISADLEALQASLGSIKPAVKPYGVSLSVAGYKPKFSASQRFASVLPEAKGRKLCYASVSSVSALVQAAVSSVLPVLDDRRRAEVAPMVALLPTECIGGLAAADWREGDRLKFIARLSADELRNLVTGFTTAFTYSMMMRSKQIDEESGEDCLSEDFGDEDVEDIDDED